MIIHNQILFNPSLDLEPEYTPPYDGIHKSLFAFTTRCAEEGLSKEETKRRLEAGIAKHALRRELDPHEIPDAIRDGYNKVFNLDESPRVEKTERYHKGEAEDAHEQQDCLEDDLRNMSPMPPPASTMEALKELFEPDELLNLGSSKTRTFTAELSEWSNCSVLTSMPYMVPNPMTARRGMTKSGVPNRPRTQSNTGPRKWVIVEFDKPPIEWQPSLIMELTDISGQLPTLVLWSGNKSLHAWWAIRDADPESVHSFEMEAVRLGADPVFCGENSRHQLVRTPMAIREDNKKVQEVLFWNPECGKEIK